LGELALGWIAYPVIVLDLPAIVIVVAGLLLYQIVGLPKLQ